MPDDYNLPRHAAESTRLEAQHEAYVKIVGYRLHPRIKAALPADARIADVGTGTGVWLRQVAEGSPSGWTFCGFDISDEQFPHTSTRDRIAYEVLNITEPVPERLHGQFDVVHLRLLVCGLVDHQWATAAQNVRRLLKPGGWIQWHECQFRDMEFVQNAPGASIENGTLAKKAVMDTLAEQGKMLDNVRRLRETVQAAGFESCEEDVYSTDRSPEVRGPLMEIQFGAIQAIGRGLAEKDPRFPMSKNEYEEVLRKTEGEMKDGKAYYRWDMRVVTARKPA